MSITTLPCEVWHQGSGVRTLILAKHVTIWNQGRSYWAWHPGYFVIHLNQKCFTHSHGRTCAWVTHTKQNWKGKSSEHVNCVVLQKSSAATPDLSKKARMLLYQELALNEDGSSLERHVTKYSHSAFTIHSIYSDTYQGLQFSQSALPTVKNVHRVLSNGFTLIKCTCIFSTCCKSLKQMEL